MTSIDYSKPATAVNFVALYANWKHIDSTHGSLTLRAGNRIYSFTTGDSKVSKKYLSAAELAESQPPRLNFEQDMDKLTSLIVGGAPSAGITAALLKMSQPTTALGIVEQEHERLLIIASVTRLGGAVAGYYFGHRTKPDYDNDVFQKTLADTTLWDTIEKDWRDAYSQEIKLKQEYYRTGNGPLIEAELLVPKEKSGLQRIFELHPEIQTQADSDWRMTSEETATHVPQPSQVIRRMYKQKRPAN
jgi:hypothetical protein